MKVVIATCFKSNDERVDFLGEYFKSKGNQVEKITSTFDHILKKNRTDFKSDFHYLPAQKYKKNISIKRLLSHSQFATDLFFMIEDLKPDLIWLIIPANSLVKMAAKYKKKYPNTKIIIDVIDMWPESLPININKFALPFKLWRNRRSNYLKYADKVVSECDYYKEILNKEINSDIETIHWSRDEDIFRSYLDLPTGSLSLCYLGSINNIIDIEEIKRIIVSFNYPVILHVIGDGEKKKEFIDVLSKVCEINDHGQVRDQIKKAEILRHCHAGLNIYKKGLYIGLTVKSIDYLQYGLPIINNIKGDTWKMIEDYNVGFNVDIKINYEEVVKMRENNEHIFNLYYKEFSRKSFMEKVNKVVEDLL